MFRRKWLLILIAILVIGGGAASYFASKREEGTLVSAESVDRRTLEALVSASGKLEPRRSVNISAQSMGRVTRLGVNEGDRVTAGQFLLQIDPVNAATAVQRDEAAVAGARTGLQQARTQIQSAQANLDLARQSLKRQQDLWEAGLTTREQLEKAVAEVDIRESDLKAREQEIQTREQQLRQQEAGLASSRHNLAQVRFESPFDGIVTRRNIEEGENVVTGTMNNPGTVLLTVADMSVIEAQVEVDETDIPLVQIGQEARVTIDAIPNRSFRGRVTEIGNSPIQAAGQQATGARTATNFKVVVTIEDEVPDVRPGFTCTAEITTATRDSAVSVPIQALTIREQEYDAQGTLVPRERPAPTSRWGRPSAAPAAPAVAPSLPPGHTRREIEGVFLIREGRATFVPVQVGIAGERHFEVLEGLSEGDQVITGPFDSVRNMFDGDQVRVQTPGTRR
ncbi:MAG: efflux RND transporter periplasmic adaptor subunit [Vicinamibacterales bacterium]|nr:efflux RND transporter periplasmic adaptor subunit [Vicinamibacterales bacterium]